MLDISVIIACFNGAETLAETLASLGRPGVETAPGRSSSPTTARPTPRWRSSWAYAAPTRACGCGWWTPAREKGKSYALNTAIRAAEGRAILFCDADDAVAPGWLAAMGAALDRHPFVAARIDLGRLSPGWTLASRGLAQQDHLSRLPYPPHCAGRRRRHARLPPRGLRGGGGVRSRLRGDGGHRLLHPGAPCGLRARLRAGGGLPLPLPRRPRRDHGGRPTATPTTGRSCAGATAPSRS